MSNVEIRIFGSRREYASLDSRDGPRVTEIIRTQVLPKSDAEYHRVDVKIRRRADQSPKYLVAYLLRKDIYLVEVVKVDVDQDLQVTETAWGYDDSAEEDEEPGGEFLVGEEEFACPYDIVAGTPVPEIDSAQKAVMYVCDEATKAGLKCKTLIGPDANLANYKAYLACGLKGFVNVGHGNTGGIVLADGVLSAAWFNSVAGQALKPAVVYFNSCQVHNDPLKSAVMNAGARTFIGGIVNLLIGASEEVCKCFWTKAISTSTPMGDILHQCEKDNYPAEGAHGITGVTGPADFIAMSLEQAMWVHGHSMQIEYPERLDLLKRMGYYIQVKGKPFTTNWFHFAIPTPVIVSGKRLCVGSVMIRFRVGPGASLNSVHIYDGETKIAAHDGLDLSPQGGFASPRFDVPTHPPIRWGLGISLGVGFGDSANLPANKLLVEVSSAGCDFGLRT